MFMLAEVGGAVAERMRQREADGALPSPLPSPSQRRERAVRPPDPRASCAPPFHSPRTPSATGHCQAARCVAGAGQCRGRYRAVWDTVPCGIPCRAGYRAAWDTAWDTVPRGEPRNAI